MKLFLIFLIAVAIGGSGCVVVTGVGMAVLYKKASLPEAQIHRDISYEAASTSPRQKLDLFLPAGTNWPVLIFVCGGGWTSGDKNLKVAGDDVYGNIGRFYAEHGIGVAVINYRLIPNVAWQEQVTDVADATAWVHAHIAEYGGDPQRFFLSGHSAGAQLVDRIALDPAPLAKAGGSAGAICGVISVSGAGLDIKDKETYDLGGSPDYFTKLFASGPNPGDWQKDASPATYVRPDAPPFLILYAGGESKALIRQSQHFNDVLKHAGAASKLVVVPGQSHTRIVLTLSRGDKTTGPEILKFIEGTKCR